MSFRIGNIIILFLLIVFNLKSYGQNVDLLKKYTRKQFDISEICNLVIEYQTDNFSLEPVTQKATSYNKPSLRNIKKLKDSLQITDDISYLKKIAFMYYALNKKDTGRFYLYEAENRYRDKLNKNPRDTALLHEICSINTLLGNIYQAMEYADTILKIYPCDLKAMSTNIALHMGIGDFAGARTYCEKAIKQFPQNPNGYLQKTLVILWEEMLNLFGKKKENFDGFNFDISFLQEAADNYPHCPEIQLAALSCKLLFLFFNITIPVGFKPPESFKNFKVPLTKIDSLELVSYENQYLSMIKDREYKNHYTLYYSLGIINFLKGEYSTAIKYFEKSSYLCGSRNEKNISSCYDNICTCYLYLSDTLEFINNIKLKIKNVTSSSSKAIGYIQLATCEMYKNHLHKGRKYFRKALELDSTAHNAYIGLANLQILNNNLELAQEYLDKCYTIKPDCPELYKSFILLSLFQGDKETAEYFVNRFISSDPEDTFARDIKRDFME